MNSITGPMDIVGEAKVVLKFDGLKHTTFALVAWGMDFTCLISWHDLQPLEIISNTFPSRISASASHDLTLSIVKDFPSVFVEKLGEQPMNVPEMRNHLTDPYVPHCVSKARPVPLRFQTMAEQIVADLVKAKVIEPESDPTEWCAPAFFVPKGDGLRVRLVTDYTKLNRYVRRPVHPFPSVKEIVQAVPAGTKFVAKMDALHGYFQLALDELSSKITTFLLPSGRYQYLRAPMGLSSSSDKWCRHSDRAIEGMPFAKKIVDDILIWATDLPTLYDRVRAMAARCADLNIALSSYLVCVDRWSGYPLFCNYRRRQLLLSLILQRHGLTCLVGLASFVVMVVPNFEESFRSSARISAYLMKFLLPTILVQMAWLNLE